MIKQLLKLNVKCFYNSPYKTYFHSKRNVTINVFLNSDSYIIAFHISLEKDQNNYCNNNLLILDVKQLYKIMKLYYFHSLKALWDGQCEIKMYYGMSRVKMQLSGKRSIPMFLNFKFIIFLTLSSEILK